MPSDNRRSSIASSSKGKGKMPRASNSSNRFYSGNDNLEPPSTSTFPLRSKSGRNSPYNTPPTMPTGKDSTPGAASGSSGGLKKIRKGTKSCIECRQRKIRCIWSSEGGDTCQNCEARGRPCVSQTYSAASTDAIRLTSRERIGQLESVVQNLCAGLERIESKLSIEVDPSDVRRSNLNSRRASAIPRTSVESDSDDSELSQVLPPEHLVQLFDNGLLGDRNTPTEFIHTPAERSPQADAFIASKRRILQRLIPSRQDVTTMEPHVTLWINMLKHIFPASLFFGTGMAMAAHYDEMMSADVYPTKVANYLLPIAITILHVPRQVVQKDMPNLSDAPAFIRSVSDAIETTIFNDDTLMATLEGVEVGLMYLRLCVLRNKVRKVWVGLRRVVAMAEMIGLPRAASRFGEQAGPYPTEQHIAQDVMTAETRRHAAKFLWDCILSVDRSMLPRKSYLWQELTTYTVHSLMFNLPMGTVAYKYEIPQSMMLNGMVHLPAVLAHLSSVAVKILDIDDSHAARRPLEEIVEKVLVADQEMRALISKTPEQWWKSPALSADAVVLFWYEYSNVRIHVQLALRNDDSNRFAYSYMRCIEACRALAERYVQLREALPTAFFAGRLLDLQALTPAIVLLHTCYKPQVLPPQMQANYVDEPSAASLVQAILNTADSISDEQGGEFAKSVAKAIRTVIELLEAASKGEARVLTIKVPLLGQIQVGRQKRASPQYTGMVPSQAAHHVDTLTAEDFEMANSMDWVMEITDDFPFMPDDIAIGEESDYLSLHNFEGSM